ncbi:MAG: hypothetical protein ABIF71_11705 [Planctomycetota bacterium]
MIRQFIAVVCLLAAGCAVPPVPSGPPAAVIPAAAPALIDLFAGETVATSALDRTVSFSCNRKTMPEIIRQINTLTGLDMALTPEIMARVQADGTRYSLQARDLPLATFLDWCARLMHCAWAGDLAPDIWFTDAAAWMRDRPAVWKSYPLLPPGEEDEGNITVEFIDEVQKGITWLRPDIRTVYDAANRRVMVNSTAAGHRRIDRLVRAMTDRRFPPYTAIDASGTGIDPAVLAVEIVCTRQEESLFALARRITAGSGLSIGYDSSLEVAPPALLLPAGKYRVADLLAKITSGTPYARLRVDAPRAVWLGHPSEPAFQRPCTVPWESMGLYVFRIEDVARMIRGDDVVQIIRRSLSAAAWEDPCTVLRYYRPLDVLIVVNRADAVRELVRFLPSLRTFGPFQTE